MRDHTKVDYRGAPGTPGGDMARLTREAWTLRAELTGVLGEIRLLEQRGRSNALGAEAAAGLKALRSRESKLHSAMATGAVALRGLREEAASEMSAGTAAAAAAAAPTG